MKLTSIVLAATLIAASAQAEDALETAANRFASADGAETPDFQRHVVPLLGRLGCNGRACHGSFQGRGDLRLSLFGYDFKMDHDGLIDRVDTDDPAESYALQKPTLVEPHEGGKRMEVGSWEYNLFLAWIAGGAKPQPEEPATLEQLAVTPSEIRFAGEAEQQPLRVVAHWSDGAIEDVTCLCRYQTNDETIASIDKEGIVTSGTMGDTHVVVFYDNAVVPVQVLQPVSDRVGDNYPVIATSSEVDRLVVEKLSKLGIVPSDRCDDAEFLRRVSLDIAGTLPTAAEVRQFLADDSADKRSRKIEELLETPAYAAWWTTQLCDWTGNSDNALNNVSPDRNRTSQDWYDWVYNRVVDNVAYDDLVAGIVLAKSREEGESYRDYSERMSAMYHKNGAGSYGKTDSLTYYWARSNFRTPEERAIGFAYTFMGTRIQCAQCHKHPFDVWTQKDFEDFQQFFARVNYARNGNNRDEYQALIKELGLDGERGGNQRRAIQEALQDGKTVPFPELVVQNPRVSQDARRKAEQARREGRDVEIPGTKARLLGSETVNVDAMDDPREALMDWLRNDEKQLFAKAFVNRAWANYFNRGIVEPTDDLSLANPPAVAGLLEYLAKGFVENDFDMKWVHREICNSDTYQRSWRPNDTNLNDERNFSRAVPRRLPAEVAYDALAMATVNDERAKTFTTDLVDGSSRRAQPRALALPGVPRGNARNTGALYALTIFGRSLRENNCDCERSAESSLLQTVFLRNDNDVLQMIDRADSWVAQLEGAGRGAKSDADNQQLATARERAERLETALERARNNGGQKQIEQLEGQLAELRKQIQELEPKPEAVEMDIGSIVEEAYLRTLSRFPTDSERELAATYLADADSSGKGIRGLMWTLINTKEFIVNH